MTAEERLAYFQGEKRRNSSLSKSNDRNWNLIWFKIKFFLSVLLFIMFLSLDYTGYKINDIGSIEIVEMVTQNIDIPIPENLHSAL